MDLASVHSLYDVLADDRFDLLYSGRFHDEHTASLISLGEDAANSGERDRAHRQRLSFVMVEAYQNIVRHRAKLSGALERGAGRCMFMLRSKPGGDEVVAIDPVEENETASLKEVLHRIGGSDLKQLKELFLDRLRNGTRTVRGGAGLGLIEIARRSGNGMQHALLPLNAGHKLFVLQVMVGAPASGATNVSELVRMHSLVAALDLVLFTRCARSPAAQEAVMHMIEKDMDGNEGPAAGIKRAYLAATEWLHGAEMEERSFVAVAKEDGAHVMVAGGCAQHAMVVRLMEEVHQLNAFSAMERERHYRNSILGRKKGPELGTGLIELARLGDGPLRVATFQVPEGMRFLVEVQLA